MNQERVSKLIKELRQKEGLTQKEFAELFKVTYQAVSKWENGLNLPDINTLKEICNHYELDINSFLEGEPKKGKKQLLWLYSIPILIIGIVLMIIFYPRNDSYEFKTITTTCESFHISGSIAYNTQKSSIYISHIDYCGGEDTIQYEEIYCTLKEKHQGEEKTIEEGKKEHNMTLENYLKNVTFYISDYKAPCKNLENHSYFLEIYATKKDSQSTTYKIPLELGTYCE